MPREIHWTDAEEIGIQLQEKYPDIDPLTVLIGSSRIAAIVPARIIGKFRP